MGSKWLQRVGRLGEVVLQQQVANAVIQSIIQTTFTLEGITLTKGSGFEQVLANLVVTTQAGLFRKSISRGQSVPTPCCTYQDERSVIISVSRVDVDTSRDLLLAHLQVTPELLLVHTRTANAAQQMFYLLQASQKIRNSSLVSSGLSSFNWPLEICCFSACNAASSSYFLITMAIWMF